MIPSFWMMVFVRVSLSYVRFQIQASQSSFSFLAQSTILRCLSITRSQWTWAFIESYIIATICLKQLSQSFHVLNSLYPCSRLTSLSNNWEQSSSQSRDFLDIFWGDCLTSGVPYSSVLESYSSELSAPGSSSGWLYIAFLLGLVVTWSSLLSSSRCALMAIVGNESHDLGS